MSQGLARLPRAFSFIFKTSRGVPRVLRRSITPLLLWTPDWHLFSRPTVASFLAPDWHFFSRPLCGVPRVLRRFITPQLLRTPDWHFFSSPTVVSLDIRPAFLFKTSPWRLSSSRMVSSDSLVDTRWAFLFYFILFVTNTLLTHTFAYAINSHAMT
jgi:hypothetical protein